MSSFTKFYTAAFIAVAMLGTACSDTSNTNEKPKDSAITEAYGDEPEFVTLSADEQKKLNTFFSSFAEINFDGFKRNEVSDAQLASFGVYHNQINNAKLFEKAADNSIKIKKEYVEKSAEKYFNRVPKVHASAPGIDFKDGYYNIPESSGEAFLFAQVLEVQDFGKGEFAATVQLFTAGSGWTGDRNANPESWAKDDDAPQLTQTVQAMYSKIGDRPVLLEYVKQ